jgi:hypothetical protein
MNYQTTGSGWVAPIWRQGDEIVQWYDPARRCVANPYPYRVDSVNFVLYNYVATDTFYFDVNIYCPRVPGDSCSGPGQMIWTAELGRILPAANSAYNIPVRLLTYATRPIVNGGFYVGIQYITHTATTGNMPSLWWWQTPDAPRCRQFFGDGYCWSDWVDYMGTGSDGNLRWWVSGNTNDAGTAITCPTISPCTVLCQTGDALEATEPATPDSTTMIADPDGGCFATPVGFGSMTCGTWKCGRLFNYTTPAGYIVGDEDWYLFSVSQMDSLRLTVISSTPVVAGIIDTNACVNPTWIAVGQTEPAYACTTIVKSACVTPGTYAVRILPASIFCPDPGVDVHYRAKIECFSCGVLTPGENCTNALTLTVPSTVNGNTCGFMDDLNAACPWAVTGGLDVVYVYSPPENQMVTFDLCGSSFDTKMYVFDGSCQGTPIGCNDDFGGTCGSDGFKSRIECLNLQVNHNYYVVVDGYDGAACGNYVLTTTICPPCQVPSVSGDVVEVTEPWPVNGTYSTTDPDGGCNNDPSPPLFMNITCGQAIYGHTFMYTDSATSSIYRDTDWYQFVVTAQEQVVWTVQGEIPVVALILQTATPPCPADVLTGLASAGICSTVVVKRCLAPGTYYLFVGGDAADVSTQQYHYRATMSCEVCPTGRCCYGRFPWLPLCADNDFLQCEALAGAWNDDSTCTANPCPVHLACQDTNAVIMQPPHNDDESWNALASDSATTDLAFENFSGATVMLGSIRFWGLDLYRSGTTWSACTEDPMPFVIRVYNDSLNYPATSTPTRSYSIAPTRTATTLSWSGYPVWEYDATLTPPIAQSAGWISIEGRGDTSCWFLWASSPYGNSRMVWWASAAFDTSNATDMSMCLGAAPCPRADSATVYMDPATTRPVLRFRAHAAGNYEIWSTTQPNGLFPIAYVLEATVPAIVGENSWSDPGTLVGFKEYLVRQNCNVQ